ncbi:SRP72 [Blepharisma stoltei]|uniref:Signal recognition particle subunit SRP72 n=1 Tax=Blepharisma stoltei TaxID=1481888 RepID=A0AAU9J5S2_9CILI|nr:unnamed protein product [Blepharisma stoltei]
MSDNPQKAYELLWQEIKGGNHSSILAICSNLQGVLPNDLDLLKTKIVALIQTSKFQEAFELIQTVQGLDFERAYISYKLGNFEDCLRVCEGKSDKAFRQLRAQAFFRLSWFEQAIAEYEDLIKNDPSSQELLINFSASFSGPGLGDRGINHFSLQHEGGWEILFNRAILQTDIGHYSEALNSLREVENIVTKDSSLEEEKWIVKAQIAYIYQLMEETQTAIEKYEEILKQTTDLNIKAMIKNNLIVAKEHENKEALNELKSSLGDENKLTALQKAGILLNYALIAFKRKKIQEAEDILKECEKYKVHERRLGSINAYILMKEKKNDEYKNFLLEKHQPWAYLLLIKILLQQHKQKEAAEISLKLKSEQSAFNDQDFYITMSHILEDAGYVQQAVELLEEGNKLFSDRKICEALGNLLMKIGELDKATSVFQQFLNKNDDKAIRSSLVIAAANSYAKWVKANPTVSEAEKNKKFQEIESLKKGLINKKDALYSLRQGDEDIFGVCDRLEYANVNWKQKVEEKKVAEVARKKRKRKPKYPKGFDPKNPNNPPPDPERWLPKKERSEYKKKNWKKQKKLKGPQGAMPEVMGQEVGSFNRGPSTAHIEAAGEKKRK